MNSTSARTMTIPANTFAEGTTIAFVKLGTGDVTIAGSGITMYSSTSDGTGKTGNRLIKGRYGTASAVCFSGNLWVLTGSLED